MSCDIWQAVTDVSFELSFLFLSILCSFILFNVLYFVLLHVLWNTVVYKTAIWQKQRNIENIYSSYKVTNYSRVDHKNVQNFLPLYRHNVASIGKIAFSWIESTVCTIVTYHTNDVTQDVTEKYWIKKAHS